MKNYMMSRVVNFRKAPDFHWHLGVVAKRVYRFEDRRCFVHEAPVPLVTSAEAEAEGTNSRDKDDYPFKPLTDVVLHGTAHAGSEVSELIAGVQVGPLRRMVRASGDRTVTEVRGGCATSFSRPVPFTSMPLSHRLSYGGFDEHAALKLDSELAAASRALGFDFAAASRFTYPRNGRGMGYFVRVDPERVVGARVPNLDDPEDPVLPERLICPAPELWYSRPIPAALDFVHSADFPRSAFFGVDPELPRPAPSLREVALGAVTPDDLGPRDLLAPPHPRAANGAVPGLAKLRLQGDEPVVLTCLHHRHRELTFRLPAERPELRIQPPGCPALEVEPALDTVYIEPDADRISLVWTGSLQVASRYPPDELNAVEHSVRWP